MAHNSYTRSGGIWNIGTSLLAAEMASIDAKTFAAINGDAGGTWAPSSLITIGGSGLSVTGNFAATASTSLGTTSADFLFVNSTTQFESAVTVGLSSATSFTVISNALFESFCGIAATGSFDCAPAGVFHGNVTLGDNNSKSLTVNATSHFSSDATFSGTTAISGVGSSLQCNAPVIIFAGNALTTAGDIVLSGAGAIAERVVLGADSDSSYGVDTADVVYIDASAITGPHTYRVKNTSAVNGKKIRFTYYGGPATGHDILLVRDIDNTGIGAGGTSLGNNSARFNWVDLQFVSGYWQRVAGSYGV